MLLLRLKDKLAVQRQPRHIVVPYQPNTQCVDVCALTVVGAILHHKVRDIINCTRVQRRRAIKFKTHQLVSAPKQSELLPVESAKTAKAHQNSAVHSGPNWQFSREKVFSLFSLIIDV